MEANELRIGNLVTDKWSEGKWPFKITSIGKIRCTYLGNQEFNAKYENIKPIPLTEDWRNKMGLGFDDELILGIDEPFHSLKLTPQNEVLVYNQSGDEFTYLGTKQFVHEIQNLAFALINKELKIKL